MQPVFDGHNDALTREDHDGIVTGRPDGHLDLPRMHAGGLRGAIFAVFSGGGRLRERTVPRDDGVLEFEYAAPLDHVHRRRARNHGGGAPGPARA